MEIVYKGYIYESLDSWFKGSKVIDSKGRPLRVYHATLGNFDEFDSNRMYEYSFIQGGFYFTDSILDAEDNYTYGGADWENKVENLTDELSFLMPDELVSRIPSIKLSQAYSDFSLDRRDYSSRNGTPTKTKLMIDRYAHDQIYGDGAFNIMPVYLKILNPYYLIHNTSYYLDNVKIKELILPLCREDVYSKTRCDKLRTYIDNNIPLDTFEFKSILSNRGIGKYKFYEILSLLGYDGVILDASMEYKDNKSLTLHPQVKHYIVFQPNQIKSSYNKDPSDSNLINK